MGVTSSDEFIPLAPKVYTVSKVSKASWASKASGASKAFKVFKASWLPIGTVGSPAWHVCPVRLGLSYDQGCDQGCALGDHPLGWLVLKVQRY